MNAHQRWCEIDRCRPLFGDDPYGPTMHVGATAVFGTPQDGVLRVELNRVDGEPTMVQVGGSTLDPVVAASLSGYLQRLVRLAAQS